ncbi:uncharacterized protein EDB91DRAFT_1243136 [Suillus paluster]|uniref:uncharacterized protein n=1 Tax=Suillus paluster TaxID=48578 RepID=UPI001B863FE1|nr:uncharacterized protein EDB91DRAFT_1243136 [Suillus paluster]KAG1752357.1 hypothetical protein EDB91DRAFT_1243136 [Suillus paluster]
MRSSRLQMKSLQEKSTALKEVVKALQVESEKPQKKGHPEVKRLVQPLFSDRCGIESSMGRNKRTEVLIMQVKPLANGSAYEKRQGEGGTADEGADDKIWHPNWLGQVDDDVNVKFIEEIVNRVYNNEKHCRENDHLKVEIPDDDFDKKVITQCTKDYFRNLHKQAMSNSDTLKTQKANQKKEYGRQRARRQTVTKSRRAAALIYEKETGKEGAVAMIDTDFASDILSYLEDDLSENTLTRRMKSGAGNSANMVVGLEWRSVDYVSFLRFLTLRQMKGNNKATTASASTNETSTSQPPKKRRKTAEGSTRSKRIVKKTFDISPEQMNEDTPLSARKNLPFDNMVADSWKNSHPDMEMLEGVPWLRGFWASLTRDDVIKEDYKYLEELEEWHKQTGMREMRAVTEELS